MSKTQNPHTQSKESVLTEVGMTDQLNSNNIIKGNEVLVWGSNKFGQLGVGSRLSSIDFPKVQNSV
jgi:alpha-tubulin suppressor-like RCC1 family protein